MIAAILPMIDQMEPDASTLAAGAPSISTSASFNRASKPCPCHGSKFDLAGRVFHGVPAPYNLPVPPYHLVNDKLIRIGENPPDVT
jgi:ubiquinol-cytochrome c reductase iron-sulfur subunit